MPVKKYYYPSKEIGTLRELLEGANRQFAAKPVFLQNRDGETREVSYAAFVDSVEALGTALCRQGIAAPAAILLGENSPEFACAFFTVLCAGGSVILTDASADVTELAAAAEKCGATLVFASESCREKAELLARSEPGLGTVFFRDFPRLFAAGKEGMNAGDNAFLSCRPRPSDTALTLCPAQDAEPVVLTHADVCADLTAIGHMILTDTDDRWLSVLPWSSQFSVTVSLLFPFAHGGCIAIGRGIRCLTRDLQENRITVLCGMPAVSVAIYRKIRQNIAAKGEKTEKKVQRYEKLTGRSLSFKKKVFEELHDSLGGHLRFLLSGGATPAGAAEGLYRLGIPVLDCYGLHAGMPLIAMNCEDAFRAGTFGVPVPGDVTDVYDRKSDGIGEIRFKPKQPPKQGGRAVRMRKGWYYTGDLGAFDRDGFLRIVGRKRNVVWTAAGYRIIPEEIERLLQHSRFVREARVAAFQNENTGGTDLVAALVPDDAALREEYGPRYSRGQTEAEMAAAVAEANFVLEGHKRIAIYVTVGPDVIALSDRKTVAAAVRKEYLKKLSRQSAD